MLKMISSRDSARKVSPPQPTTFSDQEMSEYLTSLRTNRPPRPSTGPRPIPPKAASYTAPVRENTSPCGNHTSSLQHSSRDHATGLANTETNPLSDVGNPYLRRAHSAVPAFPSVTPRPGVGRPLTQGLQGPTNSVRRTKNSDSAPISPPCPEGAQYKEMGTRWMERQEAISIKTAMEAMDQQSEEARIYTAAQEEAAELVWKHRNPDAAEHEKGAAYRYPSGQSNTKFHAPLEKGPYPRSHSAPSYEMERSVSMSKSSRSSSFAKEVKRNIDSSRTIPSVIIEVDDLPETFTELILATSAAAENRDRHLPPTKNQRRSTSGKRNVSNGSLKGVFPNPDDQIYEEPEEIRPAISNNGPQSQNGQKPLGARPRNSLLRGSRPLPDRSSTAPALGDKKLDRFEIYKNPPTQSRSAAYTMNISAPLPTIDIVVETDPPSTRNGIDIRSEDIRSATSMRLKDRSHKLPTPTAVSDRPGRPIVSFSPEWRGSGDTPRSTRDLDQHSLRPSPFVPAMSVSAPEVPTIRIADADTPAIPIINIENNLPDSVQRTDLPARAKAPAISISPSSNIPTINAPDRPPLRPLPRPSNSSPAKLSPAKGQSRLPWLNSYSRTGVPTATCDNCLLPISGRVVTASGSSSSSESPCSPLQARFHPECFTCYHCSTALECVAFYPEPESKRLERLDSQGVDASDSTELRFFCHLDFHEFFSPRCKSCKTPIEGEVIVAAGSEWHVGHFFCGECGDPFSSNTPFVEKDGYAFCVRCHTRRTSARCRACQKQILEEMTIEALGAKWHQDCFCCWECGGGFGAEGRFFVRDVEVEGTEKEKRRGLAVKVEERAVCDGCEEKRLKA